MTEINLKKTLIEAYLGRPPKTLGKMPLLNKEGILASSKLRRPTNKVLEAVLTRIVQELEIEAVGTGLKIGRKRQTDSAESLCVLHNFCDKGFEIYVLKRNIENLPKINFATDGAPIRGANTKSSRVYVVYDKNENNIDHIMKFIHSLPGAFENGMITTFNKKIKSAKKYDKTKEAPVKVETKEAPVKVETKEAPVKVETKEFKIQKVEAKPLKVEPALATFEIKKGNGVSFRQKKVKKTNVAAIQGV